jgi:hypothetical protein
MQLYSKSDILPEFILPTFVDSTLDSYGIDSVAECLDKNHFENYPYKVEYKFNDRGFRDEPWPSTDLNNCIWCVGDSFTMGLGSAKEHIWPYVLQEKTNIRTINVSLNGASNTWIARKTLALIETIKPKNIVVQWSYLQRRELEDKSLSDENRILSHIKTNKIIEDIPLTFGYIESIRELAKTNNVSVIHSFVPGYIPKNDYKVFFSKIAQIKLNFIHYKILDKARDGHHYDIKTANLLTNNIVNSGLLNI